MSIDTDEIPEPIGPDPQATLDGFPTHEAIYGKPIRRHRITITGEYSAPGPLSWGDSVILTVQGVVEDIDLKPHKEKMSKDGPSFLGPLSWSAQVKAREIIVQSVEDSQGADVTFVDGKRETG